MFNNSFKNTLYTPEEVFYVMAINKGKKIFLE